jgi:hypothetical protein
MIVAVEMVCRHYYQADKSLDVTNTKENVTYKQAGVTFGKLYEIQTRGIVHKSFLCLHKE